jgi:hypothetical protein
MRWGDPLFAKVIARAKRARAVDAAQELINGFEKTAHPVTIRFRGRGESNQRYTYVEESHVSLARVPVGARQAGKSSQVDYTTRIYRLSASKMHKRTSVSKHGKRDQRGGLSLPVKAL